MKSQTIPPHTFLRVKRCLLPLAIQAVCVAVGLWMHHRLTAISVGDAARDQAWKEMGVCADHLLRPGADPSLGGRVGDLAGLSRRNLAGESAYCLGLSFLMVDSGWEVARSSPSEPMPGGDGENVAGFAHGQRLHWHQSQTAEGAPGRMRGVLQGSGGAPHLAVAFPREQGQGYFVLHQPQAVVEDSTTGLLHSLPAIEGMTFLWTTALLSVALYLLLTRSHESMDRERGELKADAMRQTQHLVRTRDAIIFGLAKLAESRDPETGDHLERICVYVSTLAEALRQHPKFRREVNSAFVRTIGISAALHDIGKVGVADQILRKAGPLNPAEQRAVQIHTTIGGDCLREIELRLGGSNFLEMARQIAYSHHERWNGNGYPERVAGTRIPLAARIVAIADVYDALSSRRAYKDAIPHEECVALIRNEAGKQFDPDLVEVWLGVESKFRDIARHYAGIDGGQPCAVLPAAEDHRDPESRFRGRFIQSAAAVAD